MRIGSQLQDLVGGGADINHESSVTGDGIRHDTGASDDACDGAGGGGRHGLPLRGGAVPS